MSLESITLISGLSARNGLASDRNKLIDKLILAEQAPLHNYFADENEAKALGLAFNPLFVAMGKSESLNTPECVFASICDSIDCAVLDSGITSSELSAKKVQLYLAGQAVQPNIMDFAAFISRNDEEDLYIYPKIKNLNSDTHQEEGLLKKIMNRYGLARLPISLSTASCSSLSAIFPACHSINRGAIDLAIIVSIQQITPYQLVFMAGLNSLARNVHQPFSPNTEGVMLGSGTATVVLESYLHLNSRRGRALMKVQGFSTAQSSGIGKGGQSFAPDFRLIAKVIEQSLINGKIIAEEVSSVFAHGNGIRGSDQAELMAIRKLWGKNGVPTVSYKGQLGYQIATSGMTDMSVIADSIKNQRLIGFNSIHELDHNSGVNLHTSKTPLELNNKIITKISLGVEGSIAVCNLGLLQ